MDDVVRNDIDVDEALLRSNFHQDVFAHADLALSVACPAPEGPDDALEKYLRIPVIGLKKENLAARLEQPVQGLKVLGEKLVAEDRGAQYVVEAFCWEVVEEILDVNEVDIRQLLRGFEEGLIEDSSSDRIFTAQDRGQMLGPKARTCPKVENSFTRKHMERVTNCKRSPAQLYRRS